MTIFHSMTWLPFPTPTILFLVPILFLATLIIFKRSNPLASSPLNLPPRPPPLPIIGNLHQVGVLSHNSLWSLSKAYGPLMHLRLGSVPTLVISSAKLAREVMKHQDLNFCTKPSLVSQKRLSYNFLDIGFAPYGEYWREKRKVCMVELFSPKRIESFGFIREEEVARMIESISKSCSSFKPINLSDMLLRLTSNIIYRAAFGKPHKKGDENSDFYRVFEDAQALLVGMDRYAHRTASMNILIAGTDPSAATVVWAISELIRNPGIMKAAQDEVRRVNGSKKKVEESDPAQLQYLKSVLKEAFRLHSPVPLLLPRETIRHCMINGYDILPKTLVFVNAAVIGRDPEYWKNPDEFMQERFIDSEVDYKGEHFELIPFGAGRRICPGILYRTAVVELTRANLLYCFNWEFPSGMNKQNMDMSEAPGITTHKKTDLIATKL